MNNNIQKMYAEKPSIGTTFLDSEKTGKSSGQQVLLPQQTQPLPPRYCMGKVNVWCKLNIKHQKRLPQITGKAFFFTRN